MVFSGGILCFTKLIFGFIVVDAVQETIAW